ncbi:MAG: PAS domain S-box protein [Candidatus Aegiribacteria sp.]|nr:PAS domain S-box protein [Candidatus Aegiribacteria sp.]
MPPIKDASREPDLIRELKDKLHLCGSTLRTILRLSDNIVLVLDKNGIIIEASDQIEDIMGIPLKDIIGKISWEILIPDEDIKRVSGYFHDRAKGTGNPPSTYTLRVKTPGTESRFMRVNVAFIPATEDRVIVLKDLSQVVHEQRKTAETEERYRTVVENTKDGILICGEDRILFANNSFCRMTGLSREEIYTFLPVNLFHEAERDKIESLFLKSGNEAIKASVFETLIKKRKGFLSVELSSTPMIYRDTEVLLASVRDLTERKETEKKLRESHKLMKAIVDNSPVGISVRDRNGTLLMANASWRNIWKNSIEDTKGKMAPRSELRMDSKDTYLGKYIDDVEEIYRKGGELYIPKLKIPNPTPGGAEFISHHFYALKDDNAEVDKVVILTLDLTESLKAKVELKETRNQYRELTENIPTAIYRTTTESGGKIVFYNPEMQRMFFGEETGDFDEVSVKDLYVEESGRKDFLDMLAKNNEVRGFETELKRLDGSTFLASISARKVSTKEGQEEYIEGIMRDITDQRRVEEELSRIEHLESIGTLAGGIAHDFNNLLMAIQGNISLARNEEDPSKLIMRLEQAEASTEKATILTRQLLTFAKGGVPLKKLIEVAPFIQEAVIFALRGSEVEVVFDFEKNLKSIEADGEQITQVIHNITLNSVQALTGGGRINVSCDNVEMGEDSDIHLGEGEYVRISIKDKGEGIPPGDLKKIFNPYFTTKFGGSGLGLSTSYSIISRHSGAIRVFSEEGRGTEFVIYLPVIDSDGKKTVSRDEPEKEIDSTSAHILIMDDDRIVREVLSGMLDVLGHDATESSDGAEAIELYRERFASGEPFDAVIMDLTVPGGMGGEAAIEKLKEIDPDVRAIVSSGYANNMVLSNYSEYGFSGRLVKPFRISTLKKELNTVLTQA